MKRVLAIGFLLCALAATSHAQRRGFGGGRIGVGIRGGFGGVHRGFVGVHGGFGGFHRGFGGFHHGFGRFHGGFFGGGIRVGIGGRRGFGHFGFIGARPFHSFGFRFHTPSFGFGGFFPAAVPVYVGAPYAYPPAPVVIVIPPTAYEGPERISYSEPQTTAVREMPSTGGAVAFTNGDVERVLAAWTDQDELHYVTLSGRIMTVPIDQFDRYRTNALNQATGFRVGRVAEN